MDPPPLSLDASEAATVQLPSDFASVPYIDEYAGDITLSSIPNGTARPTFAEIIRSGVRDEAWLNHLYKVMTENNGVLQSTPVTYSGFLFHNQCEEDVRPRATVGVFPIFCDTASAMAMQKHAMLVIKKAIEFVNPGQVTVIEGDCPLYAQQKKCQWAYPNEVGKSKMVCFMKFLHIEMTSQDCDGKLLTGSDWDRMFSLAGIFTTSIATSLLAGTHVKRTRYAYQLTLAWFHVLKVQAYDHYCRDVYWLHEPMEMWDKRLTSNVPTISYWTSLREYLLINCRFVRDQRLDDWLLTLNTCDDICPWFFAFGHTNYARWVLVFLRDMARLPTHQSMRRLWQGSWSCNVATRSLQ